GPAAHGRARAHGGHGGSVGPSPPGRVDRAVGPDGGADRAAPAGAGDRDATAPASGSAGARRAGLLANGLSDGRLPLSRALDRPARAGHHPGPEVVEMK